MIKCGLMVLVIAFSQSSMADVYKFIDSHGSVFYTDKPRNDLYQRIIKSVPRPIPVLKEAPPVDNRDDPMNLGHLITPNKNSFDRFIEQTAYRHQVDARLVHAVIETESAYNVTAQSPKGAVGLMQLMPDTAKRFGVVDRTNPQQNVDGGTRYLKYLINLFKPNLGLALAAYNAGENAVLRNNNQIPPYPETQNYVRQVLSLYRQKTAFN